MLRTCSVCKQEKNVDEFGLMKPRANGKQYFRSDCRSCVSDRLKAYKQSDIGKEQQRLAARRYMADRKLLADAALEAIKAGLIKDPRT